jgi:hypothetical protein
MGIPEGLGVFCPPSALFVAYPAMAGLAPHALNLDKKPQANVKVFAGHYTRRSLPGLVFVSFISHA